MEYVFDIVYHYCNGLRKVHPFGISIYNVSITRNLVGVGYNFHWVVVTNVNNYFFTRNQRDLHKFERDNYGNNRVYFVTYDNKD